MSSRLGTITAQGVTVGVALVTDPVSQSRFDTEENGAFLLRFSTATGVGTDTIDVYVQSSVDGAVWDDFIHFPQVTVTQAAAGAARLAYWSSEIVPPTPVKTPQDAALAAGVQQGPIGEFVRVKVVVAGSTGAFTGVVDVSFPDEK